MRWQAFPDLLSPFCNPGGHNPKLRRDSCSRRSRALPTVTRSLHWWSTPSSSGSVTSLVTRLIASGHSSHSFWHQSSLVASGTGCNPSVVIPPSNVLAAATSPYWAIKVRVVARSASSCPPKPPVNGNPSELACIAEPKHCPQPARRRFLRPRFFLFFFILLTFNYKYAIIICSLKNRLFHPPTW